MSVHRPDPNRLLQEFHEREERGRRGRLKIFFGYAAGVGKTFAMLTAAQRERAAGSDVVIGYVECHGRMQTEALLEGLESIPARQIPYRGILLGEFDLDAALARKPQLILVDELAHSNAEGSRHIKRWQDIEELLSFGINVFTTLNVQHIESLNDVIAQVTGVAVQETLPDAVLENADEFELIDISPDELIQRLNDGKMYLPEQAERAFGSFFQEGNLTALRELSLLQAANRLRRDVDAARQIRSASTPWAIRERLLVCVSPSPTTVRLIRRAKRMASAFGAEWMAVAVDVRGGASSWGRERIAKHLRLAEQLGAEAQETVGANVADTILEHARLRNVTKIIVGKTAQAWWRRILRWTVVDQLLEKSGDIDVYVIRGEGEASRRPSSVVKEAIEWTAYAGSTLIIGASAALAAIGWKLGLDESNTVMIFLAGVVCTATRYKRGPSIFAAVVSVLLFDFFFVPPFFTLTVSDSQYILTFAVMLGIGLLIGTLMARIREQLIASQQQEQRTAALYRLTKEMSEVGGSDFLLATAGRQLAEMFAGEIVIYLRDPDGRVVLRFGAGTSIAAQSINPIVAHWVIEHDQAAGLGTDTLPNATALFAPLSGSRGTFGAIGLRLAEVEELSDTQRRRLFETAASLIALSLEREKSALEASDAQVQVKAEQLRSSLLSSVSHDLRTPLATIGGAASSLLQDPHIESRNELLQMVVEESRRLSRLVDNLLDMTRLEAGALGNKEWHVLEEIVGSAVRRLAAELARHKVVVRIPPDIPLLRLDGLLFEQVFVNLLENAARYTPAGSNIEIQAQQSGASVEICVSDSGPGLPTGTERKVFEKFFRGSSGSPDGRRGVGLGLAIAMAIVQAHDGTMEARNRAQGGAEFVFRLPCIEQPPSVALDDPMPATV